MKRVRRLLPFVVSVLLLGVLASYAPWDDVLNILGDFKLSAIGALVGLSALYYVMKSIRFWYLLQAIGIYKPFGLVSLSYMSAQPISLLPAGEVFRSHSLRRFTGVPVRKSIAQFTMQGLLEAASLGILMVVSALTLHVLRIPAVILIVLVIGAIVGIQRGYLTSFIRGLNKLPLISINEKSIDRFNDQQREVISRQWLPFLMLLSFAIELTGVAIAYISVTSIGGDINIYQAALLYVVPVIVGFITLLPGGFGASEQSAVGVLLLAGIPIAHAVASTLIMRVTIVGLGFVYGVIAFVSGNLLFPRKSLAPDAHSANAN
jgi:uncharacterized protein (TIRG00374 family)